MFVEWSLESIGLLALAAEPGSIPETAAGAAYSLLVLTLVLEIPPLARPVACPAVRRWRLACRRVSDPSVFQAMVAGGTGRLNGRRLVPPPVRVGELVELVQEEVVEARVLSDCIDGK